eukprot:g6121.t1
MSTAYSSDSSLPCGCLLVEGPAGNACSYNSGGCADAGSAYQCGGDGGTSTTSINCLCAVIPTDPTISGYSSGSPAIYSVGTAIASNTPTTGGGANHPTTVYLVSPALPSGLSLSTATGVITGTPSVEHAQSDFVITVTNDNPGGDSASYTLAIQVVSGGCAEGQRQGPGTGSYQGTIRDADSGVDGLDFASIDTSSPYTQGGSGAFVISPNGRWLYVISSYEDSLTHFDVSQVDGSLTFGSILKNSDAVQIYMPRAIAICPDGLHVYIASHGGGYDSLVWFSVDQTTGVLTYINYVTDNDRTRDVYGIQCDPTNNFIYISSEDDASVSTFTRNTASGALAYGSHYRDTSKLSYAKGISLAPDGNNLYATSEGGDRLVWFSVNRASGELTYAGELTNSETWPGNSRSTTHGLEEPSVVVVAPNNKLVFAYSTYHDRILSFTRNTGTGALSFVNWHWGESQAPYMINGGNPQLTQMLAVSADSSMIYAVGPWTDSVTALNIDSSTGAVSSNVRMPCGLFVNRRKCRPADGSFAYTSALGDNKLSWLTRDTSIGALRRTSYSDSITIPKNKLVYFDANKVTGALTFGGVLTNADMIEPFSLALSADGLSLVVASRNSSEGVLGISPGGSIIWFDVTPACADCPSGHYTSTVGKSACTAKSIM